MFMVITTCTADGITVHFPLLSSPALLKIMVCLNPCPRVKRMGAAVPLTGAGKEPTESLDRNLLPGVSDSGLPYTDRLACRFLCNFAAGHMNEAGQRQKTLPHWTPLGPSRRP